MRMVLVVVVVLIQLGVPRQGEASAQDPPGSTLFSSQEVLSLILETDLEEVLSDRSEESSDRPALLMVQGAGGESLEVPLQVRTRGRYRLQKDICSFPPLRLNFQETRPLGTVFDGQDKIKLVTHCNDRNSFEQNVLEEYLAYRIYNQLSDVSFRVRLAEITYRDSGGGRDPLTRMAFLIEDDEALAARVGGMALDIPGARATDFEAGQMGIMFLFQYLIGNIDWSTANAQNLTVVRVGSDHFAVPYDFDWSGLVDASYVGPSPLTERLHDSVRERIYLGVCWDEIDYRGTFSLLEEKKEALLRLPGEVPGLSETNQRLASEYIQEFYEFIERPGRAHDALKRMCRGG